MSHFLIYILAEPPVHSSRASWGGGKYATILLYQGFECWGELGQLIREQLIKSKYSANLMLSVLASALANLSNVRQKTERKHTELTSTVN